MGRASISSARDFTRVHRTGARGRSDGITVHVLDSGVPRTRVGLAVPRGAGSAVARNKLRRRLKEIVRTNAQPQGLDVVVRASSEAASLSFGQLEAHTRAALKRAGGITR